MRAVDSFDLARAAPRVESVLATHSRPGSSVPAVEDLGGALAPRRGRRRPRRARARCATRRRRRARRASRELLLAVGERQRVDGRGRRDRSRGAARRARRTARRATIARRAARATRSSVSQVSCSASTARAVGRRRVVDLVREPGRQRAERDERLALARQRLHAAHRLEEALDQVDAEREPGLRASSPERRRRHPQHPPAARAARRWRGRCRRRPRPGTRRPTRPGRSIVVITTDSSCPARRTRSTRPSSSTHQDSAGSPSRNSILAVVEGHLLAAPRAARAAARRSSPSKRKIGRELVDVHQIVAR